VLKHESEVPTTQNAECTVKTGRWYSYYNATSYTRASSLQIDHLPVKNVWISGGWAWTQATRVAYYNDLDDPRTLVASRQPRQRVQGRPDAGRVAAAREPLSVHPRVHIREVAVGTHGDKT